MTGVASISSALLRSCVIALAAIAVATLRFVGALAVGFFLLFILNVMLLFAGVERFHGIIMVAGLVVTVAAATRIAARGNLSTFDRAAGTAAAGIFLLTFAGLFVAAAAGLGLLAILWFFVALAGAGAAIDALLERVLVFMCLMQIGIGAGLAATWLLWRRRHGHAGLRA